MTMENKCNSCGINNICIRNTFFHTYKCTQEDVAIIRWEHLQWNQLYLYHQMIAPSANWHQNIMGSIWRIRPPSANIISSSQSKEEEGRWTIDQALWSWKTQWSIHCQTVWNWIENCFRLLQNEWTIKNQWTRYKNVATKSAEEATGRRGKWSEY